MQPSNNNWAYLHKEGQPQGGRGLLADDVPAQHGGAVRGGGDVVDQRLVDHQVQQLPPVGHGQHGQVVAQAGGAGPQRDGHVLPVHGAVCQHRPGSSVAACRSLVVWFTGSCVA